MAEIFGKAVVGSRLFMSTVLPITVDDECGGVRETGDKGSETEKVDVTTIDSGITKEALGMQGASEVSYTFLETLETIKAQTALINKDVWVYEETENTLNTREKVGNGVLMRVKLGSITITGAAPNNAREFTQSGVMISNEIYYADMSGATPSYISTVSGTVTDTPE